MSFKAVDPKQSFPKLEEAILEFWKKKNIFQKTLAKNKKGKRYVFYEGPPTANGQPGIHHVLARAFKDVMPRYKTMNGYLVERKGGWDTHGLPVELQVEKEIGISGKPDIEKYGIAEFNQKCKESVWKYTEAWEKLTERMGYWVDMEHPYVTYHTPYVESLWWVFRQIWDKGLLYKDFKIVPYCARCGTPLSSHEVALGYKDVKDISVTAKFKVKGEDNLYLLAWTTTPWTLIGNTALTVGPKIDYVKIKKGDEFLVLAKARMDAYKKELGEDIEIVEEFKGAKLVGLEYEPLYPFWGGKFEEKGWYVVGEDFVTTEDGSGIVHMALYGEDDYNVIKKYNMPRIKHVNEEGKFIAGTGQFAGKYFKQEGLDIEILKELGARGLAFHKEKYEHSYPHCWRCDTELMYFAIDSWYIKMSELRNNLVKNNKAINWYPENVKEGRFGKWLEEIRDWAISRSRYWGTPLPIWECTGCDHKLCVGSVEELEKLGGSLPKNKEGEVDLHRPYVDDIKIKCEKCGKEMKRVEDVADCWFDSGSMPVAQLHYPFEHEKDFKNYFPAEFICEAVDQTRGWFYTLLAVSTLLFDQTSYKNVICLGHILDGEGKKMSKSKGNVVAPWEVFDKEGADSCRWYMYSASPSGNSRNFSVELVDKSLRKFLLTLWNTYSFFVTYAAIDNYKPAEIKKPEHKLDRWIISALHKLTSDVTSSLENYDLFGATHLMEDFVDELSNWYVRRSRKRFWKTENDGDKKQAYDTLYTVLVTFAKLLAPFMPFTAEEIFTNLSKESESVHLSDWPKANKKLIDEDLNKEMSLMRLAVSLGHAVRSEHNLKVRQPLASAQIVSKAKLSTEDLAVIAEELNVKKVELVKEMKEVAQQVVKINAGVLGPKIGGKVQEVIKLAKEGKFEINGDRVKVGDQVLEGAEFEIVFEAKEGFAVAGDQGVVVALDTNVTAELQAEGYAREVVRYIQDLRKQANYQVDDRIKSFVVTEDAELKKALEQFKDYIASETLSEKLELGKEFEADESVEKKVEGKAVKVGVKK
ncbi:MAG: isoleucine--tRNA ligase [Candidatus Gracilibacteria bacterium]|nr:isoleucine--tRNA ligase [Candidatus Gracilibacteria bacterium]